MEPRVYPWGSMRFSGSAKDNNFNKKGDPMLERIIDGVLDVLMMALLVALAVLGTLVLGG
ncbi:MAG: hypothetical protein K9L59_11310 [Desulfobacterales bacterium]|nr:hypothetical protein [Desulfobacterales bacterium]